MKSPVKYVTWNVNSARARLGHILAFLRSHQPDVVCLQEIKCTEEAFPFAEMASLGYEAAVSGQPTYNGVAILSRTKATLVETGLDHQARVIAGTALGIRWINVYVPNGQRVGSEKYRYKLSWLQALEPFLLQQKERFGDFVLVGDFNIILHDLDVAHPRDWEGTVLCDPVTRRLIESTIDRIGLVDILRMHAPGPGVYTWWDYRSMGYPRNDGIRIDHILATGALAARSVNAWVDVEERGRERPSDHAPVLARLLPNAHPAT